MHPRVVVGAVAVGDLGQALTRPSELDPLGDLEPAGAQVELADDVDRDGDLAGHRSGRRIGRGAHHHARRGAHGGRRGGRVRVQPHHDLGLRVAPRGRYGDEARRHPAGQPGGVEGDRPGGAVDPRDAEPHVRRAAGRERDAALRAVAPAQAEVGQRQRVRDVEGEVVHLPAARGTVGLDLDPGDVAGAEETESELRANTPAPVLTVVKSWPTTCSEAS